MNCDSSNPAIGLFRKGGWVDTYGNIHGTEDPGPTYHAFLGSDYVSKIGKMDWVFMRGRVTATAATIIDESRNGRFPSDSLFRQCHGRGASGEWGPRRKDRTPNKP